MGIPIYHYPEEPEDPYEAVEKFVQAVKDLHDTIPWYIAEWMLLANLQGELPENPSSDDLVKFLTENSELFGSLQNKREYDIDVLFEKIHCDVYLVDVFRKILRPSLFNELMSPYGPSTHM